MLSIPRRQNRSKVDAAAVNPHIALMDVSHLLEDLNAAQRDAVSAAAGNYLVLAGAGSGKTRVLVHRIAWLIEVMGVSPHGVLAVTFTNKAAGEMRLRTEQLLGYPGRGMWIGTFHGLAHRLLRMHWQDAGLPETFQILDADDQLRLIRRILKDMNLDEQRWPARRAQWYINDCKDEGRRPQHIDHGDDPIVRQWLEIYQYYEEQCQRSGLIDFAEILLRAHELFLNNPAVLNHYQERFGQLLVDEFQDTNTLQYAWIRLLAGDRGNVFIVGDDDQSIYGWRGARVENMSLFSRDFTDVKTIKLEQNYRSTSTILNAANAIIGNNAGRLGKNLWTDAGDGEPIQLYAAYNEQDEARFVVDRVEQWLDDGHDAKECALLYRSNAQSRLFEEQLMSRRIPYRVYGGLRFFERAEIKDALAFLRLTANRDDDAAFERVVNVPARGIGAKTVDEVRREAQRTQLPLWRAATGLIESQRLAPRAAKCLAMFLQLIDLLDEELADKTLDEQVYRAIQSTELLTHYQKEPQERYETRKENLDELISAAKGFRLPPEDDEAGMSELASFLSHAALEAGEGQAEAWEDCVQLMTLHSAKGLEFPLVFLCGVEEGLFPHQRSAEEPGRMEEERRLCYVGVTRARRQLYISYAESRRWHGSEQYNRPSRFIREIPSELMHEIRPKVSVSRPVAPYSSSVQTELQDDIGFKLGQRVSHAKFGDGVITDFEGSGEHAQVHVNFENVGTKILVLAYANLQTL